MSSRRITPAAATFTHIAASSNCPTGRERTPKSPTNGKSRGASSAIQTDANRMRARSQQDPQQSEPAPTELSLTDTLTTLLAQIGERLSLLDQRLHQTEQMLAALQQFATMSPTVPKLWYSTKEVSEILGKAHFTVREWCRFGRIHCERSQSGRGADKEWRVSLEEIYRIRNYGLLPTTPTK